MAGAAVSPCIFCRIVSGASSTTLIHQDDKVVAFPDINPSAFRHYLVIPVEHIGTVKDLQRIPEHYALVSHMLEVGKSLLQRDAPASEERRSTVIFLPVGIYNAYLAFGTSHDIDPDEAENASINYSTDLAFTNLLLTALTIFTFIVLHFPSYQGGKSASTFH